MKEKTFLSIDQARKNKFNANWAHQSGKVPSFIGTKIFESYTVEDIREYIDWTPFFHGWGLKGIFPAILNKEKVGPEARRLYQEAQDLLDQISREKMLEPKAIIGLFPANSRGDDIVVYENDEREKEIGIFPMLRQQEVRGANKDEFMSLSDFIAPENEGVKDYIGAFAVTSGHTVEEHVNSFKQQGDSYTSIMFRLVADRITEAFAELIHERTRKQCWGYAKDENLEKADLIKERYKGIRPAPGYPACPDHTLKGAIFDLLDVKNKIGIELTESYVMKPVSSVSGLFISHQDSRYFGIGKINRDQLEDYSERAENEIKEAEKWLKPVLSDSEQMN